MEAGDTFRFGHGHLQVVISDPSLDREKVVIVNMTTDRGKDPACILIPGDHPFVKHNTSIRYDKARIAADKEIEWLISTSAATREEAVCDAVLERIRRGAAVTAEIPFGCKQVLINQGLIEP